MADDNCPNCGCSFFACHEHKTWNGAWCCDKCTHDDDDDLGESPKASNNSTTTVIDVDAELAELTAAYGAWQTALVRIHLRVRAGENVALDDPAMDALKTAYKRHDLAKRRVDAIVYGWTIPTT